MSKYRAKKTTVDGISFDSIKEARRYQTLRLLEKAGQIQNLALQVPFVIVPATGKNRAAKYVADFVYTENGKTVTEDCKGMKTREYVLKKKLMLHVHGIEIVES